MKKLARIATLLLATCAFGPGAFGQIADDASRRDTAAHFGEAMAKGLNERDGKAVAALIDLHALAQRVAEIQSSSAVEQSKLVREIEAGGSAQLISGYFQTLNATHGRAKFMRVAGTRPARALLRLDLGRSGYDYLEFVVETHDGQTRAVDWFQLSTGELVSTTIGALTQLFTAQDPGLLGRLFGAENVDKNAAETFRKISELHHAGKYAEALAALKTLPEPIRDSRIMLSVAATMARMSKQDDEYDRVLAKLAEKYGDDPAASFKLLDHYFTQKNQPALLKALDTIEKRVGVDGVQRQMRASAYFMVDDFANCLKYAEESIKLEPDRLGGYDTRASALVGLGRYPDAVAQYRDMEGKFGLKFSRAIFASDPHSAKFVASPAFAAWLPK
jgi:tetratricopeptide (TPR) repeat protein